MVKNSRLLFFLTLFFGLPFIFPVVAFADVIQQDNSVLSGDTGSNGGGTIFFNIGNGYSGHFTAARMQGTFVPLASGAIYNDPQPNRLIVGIDQFKDKNENQFVSECNYYYQFSTTTAGVATSSEFMLPTPYSQVNGCDVSPENYIAVSVYALSFDHAQINGTDSPQPPFSPLGSDFTGITIPYFVLQGITQTGTSTSIGSAAANLAKQLVNQNYLLGGKGYDAIGRQFVSTATVENGYNYWLNGPMQFGNGVDCSGLVAWSYDRTNDPTKFFTQNYIGEPDANDQYIYNMQATSTTQTGLPGGLQPGDLLFYDFTGDKTIDHVAMYVGGNASTNVVNAQNEANGIRTNSLSVMANLTGFIAFGRPKSFVVAMSVTKHSPIHLAVTEPDGNAISDSTGFATSEEFVRQSGDLTYATTGVDSNGYPEDVVYSPILKQGAYRIAVSPLPGTQPAQTYSLDFTAGNTTISLAQNVPLSRIPKGGYSVIVGPNNSVVFDSIPPEAHVGFSTTTKAILTSGSDNLSVPTIITNATSTVIVDAAGNSLTLAVSQKISQSNYASLVIPSFTYSSGTTTAATTALRYFWLTDKAGKYILFISAIHTPTQRIVSIYDPLQNKTYIVSSNPSDDTSDLSTQVVALLLRSKTQTFAGMDVPSVSTNQGSVVVGY